MVGSIEGILTLIHSALDKEIHHHFGYIVPLEMIEDDRDRCYYIIIIKIID